MLVKTFSFVVIAIDRVGVMTCKFDRSLPLFLFYLPVPTRTRIEGVGH